MAVVERSGDRRVLGVPVNRPFKFGGAASVITSGIVGAVLVTGAVIALAPLRALARIWPYALVAGAVGGIVFEQAMQAELGPEALVVGTGYAAWQVLVCLAIDRGASTR